MTSFTHSYKLDRTLFHSGRRLFWRRKILPLGVTTIIALVIGVYSFLEREGAEPLAYAAVMLLTCAFFGVAGVIGYHVRSRRQEDEWMKRMDGATATLSVDDEGLALDVPDQRSWIRWSVLREVWCNPSAWLFFTRGRSDAIIVSAHAFDGGAGAFARVKAREAGAWVRDV